ncbi:MAG: protein-glutamate O-methyltransferase CheR, partial [Myxococcota bacterium]|nr:protein-glutamate O-methyltransferase CheR [Myxococcota bacterium]
MQPTEIEELELDLLLEGVFRRYGYDFRHYARASLERRVRQFAFAKHFSTISALLAQVIHDEALFSELAQQFSVSVTEMFRDPPVFRLWRECVLPRLAGFPVGKVWAAGCASG